MTAAEAWPLRIVACDELISRIAALIGSDVDRTSIGCPDSGLADTASPAIAAEHKARGPPLDAAIRAWTTALWNPCGLETGR
jgi:hypothetical protein